MWIMPHFEELVLGFHEFYYIWMLGAPMKTDWMLTLIMDRLLSFLFT